MVSRPSSLCIEPMLTILPRRRGTITRHGLRHDENRLLVDGDDVVPVLLRKLGERVAALDAGVVDQTSIAPISASDTIDGSVHRLGIGDVERRRIGAQALFAQAIGGVSGMFVGGGVDQNMRALLRQAARQQKTDAARGAGDQDNFVIQ